MTSTSNKDELDFDSIQQRNPDIMKLTDEPEITHFKKKPKRYTNFASESFILDFEESIKFGSSSGCTIPWNGDLIHKMYLRVVLPSFTNLITNNNLDLSLHSLWDAGNTMYQKCRDYVRVIIPWYWEVINLLKIDNITFNHIKASLDPMILTNPYHDKYFELTTSISDYNSLLDSQFSNDELLNTEAINQEDLNILNSTKIPERINYINSNVGNDSNLNEFEKNQLKISALKNYIQSVKVKLDTYYDRILRIYQYLETKNSKINSSYVNAKWTDNVGIKMIKKIELEIGGINIITYDDQLLEILLKMKSHALKDNFNRMVGNVAVNTTSSITKREQELFIPLPYWFTETSMTALPLISMQYSEVRIDVEFKSLQEILSFDQTDIFIPWNELLTQDIETNLYVDYIYLDKQERQKFPSIPHQQIIEVPIKQSLIITDQIKQINLNTNNGLVKEVFWKIYNPDTTEQYNQIHSVTVQLNDYQYNTQEGKYYNLITSRDRRYIAIDDIFYLSFSLFPNDHQPSGLMNFTNIDNFIISFDGLEVGSEVDFWVMEYRIFSIHNGRGYLV